MKIRAKQVQILVIVLAGALILFGSLNALFHFMPDSALADKITDGLFISGVVAYMWSWKLRRNEAAEAESARAEIEEKGSDSSD